jgi:hypothetical protein
MEDTEEIENKKPVPKSDLAGGWGILLLEVAWIFFVHNFYPVFCMRFFGDGPDSFMYTMANFYIYLGLILLPPTLLNTLRFIFQRKKQQLIGRYITAQVVVLIVFAAIIWGSFSWDF